MQDMNLNHSLPLEFWYTVIFISRWLYLNSIINGLGMSNEDVLLWAGFRNLQSWLRQVVTQKLHKTFVIFFKHQVYI